MAKSKFDEPVSVKENPKTEVKTTAKSDPLTVKDITEGFTTIPKMIKNLIILRLGIGVALKVLALVCCFIDVPQGLSFSYGLFFFSGIMIISGIFLLIKGLTGKYITLQGKCVNIELTSIRGKIKYLYLKTEKDNGEIITVRFPPKTGAKKFNIGDDIIMYISANSLLTEIDGIFSINEYYGVDFLPKNTST